MKKSVVVAPTVAVVGFMAAALLAASAGSFAEPLPEPRDGVVLPTVMATPGPTSNTPTATSTSGPGTSSAANHTQAATSPSHQPTGSGEQSGSGSTTSGQGKHQQGQPVSNPGPKHP